MRRISTQSHATARGLQLPICSLDPRWQQPIAAQQVLDGYGKPNEAACASIGSDITSGTLRFFEPCHQSASRLPIKAARRGRFCYLGGRLIWCGGAMAHPARATIKTPAQEQ